MIDNNLAYFTRKFVGHETEGTCTRNRSRKSQTVVAYKLETKQIALFRASCSFEPLPQLILSSNYSTRNHDTFCVTIQYILDAQLAEYHVIMIAFIVSDYCLAIWSTQNETSVKRQISVERYRVGSKVHGRIRGSVGNSRHFAVARNGHIVNHCNVLFSKIDHNFNLLLLLGQA